MAGTAIETPPYQLGANDAYQGNEAGLDPTIPGVVREIGPGVTMSINTVAREILGDGRAAADGKLLNTLRDISDHLHANDGAALRGRHHGAEGQLDSCSRSAPATARMTNRLEAATSRLDQIPGASRTALEHRGRRHRQDDHPVQLAERRLPGLAAGRREHRAVVANGFPPLSR